MAAKKDGFDFWFVVALVIALSIFALVFWVIGLIHNAIFDTKISTLNVFFISTLSIIFARTVGIVAKYLKEKVA